MPSRTAMNFQSGSLHIVQLSNYQILTMNIQIIKSIVDWTARKFHIAGPFALAITNRLLELGWIRHGKVHRSIKVTELGHLALIYCHDNIFKIILLRLIFSVSHKNLSIV